MTKILIVEDDLMIADLLEDALIKGGYEVCGIAGTVPEAIALGKRHRPDLAVIDIRLADGGIGTDVAAELAKHGRVGVLYATGNAGQVRLTMTEGDACIAKPYRPRDVVRALEIVEQIMRTGVASKPFPNGFQILRSALTETAVMPV